MRNVFQERKKKMYTESEITLTDINGLVACLISSHQTLLSSHSVYRRGDISGQRRNGLKSATISSAYYIHTRMAVIEILHPSRDPRAIKRTGT